MAGFLIYQQNAVLKKLSPDSEDADKEGYVVVNPNFKVNIQPAGPEYIALTPMGETGKMYRGFTTCPGVKVGMIIETSGTITASGLRLKVLGVEEWSGPLGTHYNLTLLQPGE
jgi:hypothetical protein